MRSSAGARGFSDASCAVARCRWRQSGSAGFGYRAVSVACRRAQGAGGVEPVSRALGSRGLPLGGGLGLGWFWSRIFQRWFLGEWGGGGACCFFAAKSRATIPWTQPWRGLPGVLGPGRGRHFGEEVGGRAGDGTRILADAGGTRGGSFSVAAPRRRLHPWGFEGQGGGADLAELVRSCPGEGAGRDAPIRGARMSCSPRPQPPRPARHGGQRVGGAGSRVCWVPSLELAGEERRV